VSIPRTEKSLNVFAMSRSGFNIIVESKKLEEKRAKRKWEAE